MIVNEITSAYQSFYARNTVNNKVYSWGNGDSFILGNKKEKSEKNPYLIDFNFFKNMKVSQLEMGCSHVAVLLTKEERVYINNKKEEKKKEEEKVIKPKKRKSADENEDNLEKNKDNDKLEKVKANYIREEFITLNVRDKPKIFKILNYK